MVMKTRMDPTLGLVRRPNYCGLVGETQVISLHQKTAELILADGRQHQPHFEGVRLFLWDAPWTYSNTGTNGNAEGHYDGLSLPAIAAHMRQAYQIAAEDSYSLFWITFPIWCEIMNEVASGSRSAFLRRLGGWRWKTGGAWTKSGTWGAGFHLRGDSEVMLVLVKGNPKPVHPGGGQLPSAPRGAWDSPDPEAEYHHVTGCNAPRGKHSAKPVEWMREVCRALCKPGDLVMEPYAGLAPLARVAMDLGLDYEGTEPDTERHGLASALLEGHYYKQLRREDVAAGGMRE